MTEQDEKDMEKPNRGAKQDKEMTRQKISTKADELLTNTNNKNNNNNNNNNSNDQNGQINIDFRIKQEQEDQQHQQRDIEDYLLLQVFGKTSVESEIYLGGSTTTITTSCIKKVEAQQSKDDKDDNNDDYDNNDGTKNIDEEQDEKENQENEDNLNASEDEHENGIEQKKKEKENRKKIGKYNPQITFDKLKNKVEGHPSVFLRRNYCRTRFFKILEWHLLCQEALLNRLKQQADEEEKKQKVAPIALDLEAVVRKGLFVFERLEGSSLAKNRPKRKAAQSNKKDT